MTTLNKLNISDCRKGLLKKHFSTLELLNDHIKQIESEKNLNAFITTTLDLAKKQAEASQKKINSNEARKLEGIPISVKDNFCVKGIKTTCASKTLSNFIPPYTATTVNNVLKQGAVLLGKTNMDEFAMGSSNTTSFFGPVINPHKQSAKIVPGGSSGGSATSVSAFMSMGSFGSDTGGSIRQPAAFTGIVGIKPSYGRASRSGLIAFASSLDQAGIFARSVEDAAILLSEMIGFDKNDSTSNNYPYENLFDNQPEKISGIKIGIVKNLNSIITTHEEINKMQENFCQIIKDNKGEIIEIEMQFFKEALATYYIISSCEASSNLAKYTGLIYGHRCQEQSMNFHDIISKNRTEGFGDEVKTRVLMGTYMLSSDLMESYYTKAQKIRRLILNNFIESFKKVDVIIMPTVLHEAFQQDEISENPVDMYNNDTLTILANLCGIPAISIPCAVSKNQLPLAMQIMGPINSEKLIIRIAHFIEKNINIDFSPKGY